MDGKIIKKGGSKLLFAVAVMICTVALLLSSSAFSVSAAGTENGERRLCVGGFAFGVRFNTKGVLVIGTDEITSGGKGIDPAKEAGIKAKDIVLSIDGIEVTSAADIAEKVAASGGKELKFTLARDGKELNVTLTPARDDESGIYRAGLQLRDSMAGIGTVTYVDPESGAYGGLGHGICDPETGVLMPLLRGSAMKVGIGGVVKGKSGKPGEIKGYFLSERSGNVLSNTACGVFGYFSGKPDLSESVPIAKRYDVKEGKAEIYCTLGDDGICKYEIEISKINRLSTSDNKSFVITVTDEALKERTGGIIQGMSGSPIVQDGKLVGAVTHVLIADPTKGYGIFIENMLSQAS